MWRTLKIGAAMASASFILVACTDDLQTLRDTKPQGSAFTQNLAREYLRFANFEADEMYDWPDAYHFAAKGLAAARGTEVVPEKSTDWNLPKARIKPIDQGRKRLAAMFETGIKQGRPDTAAHAQASFDCWLEQQEENWQADHIAACRDGFMAALDALETSPEVQAARFTMVLFPFDQATLDPAEFATLSAIVIRARALGFAEISVTGHTDRAGKAGYNMALSLRRAEVVRQALIRHAVPAALIRVAGRGESAPRVITPDGKREAINRRVEIELRKPAAAQLGNTAAIVANW